MYAPSIKDLLWRLVNYTFHCLALAGLFGIGLATTAGAAEISVPLSLYLVYYPGGPNSLSGLPTSMNAYLTIAVTPPTAPSGGKTIKIDENLPVGTTTLQQAASDLHFIGFDWVQTITIPDPSPHFSPNRVHWGSDSERIVLQPRFFSDP